MPTTQVTMPSLSSDGWVTSPILTADYIFQHFFLSDASQIEPIGNNKATSFAEILANTSGVIYETCNKLQNVLKEYFSNYFSDVEVEVAESTASKADEYNSRVSLDIYVGFTDLAGKKYNLARILATENMKVVEIIKLNNGS